MTWWRVPLTLAPVGPLVLGVRASVRLFRQLDELERQIQLLCSPGLSLKRWRGGAALSVGQHAPRF